MFRAEVTRGEDRLRLDWTTDSAFRFFPVLPDEDFGYCLHQADLATNKVLALAGRLEIRDFLDILLIDRSYLSLGATVWAACGKDQGYTPSLLLDQTNRHSRYQESDLKGEHLARPVDLRELKQQWLDARARAERLFEQLPAEELGCLYLDADNKPVTPDLSSPDFPKLTRHFGSIRGAWPKISCTGRQCSPSGPAYDLLPSVRADLLFKLGRFDGARPEFEHAALLTRNARERKLLLERARTCACGSTPPEPG